MNFKLEIGDGIFYSIISIIIIVLLWLKYIEKHLPLWWALIVWGIVLVFIIYGMISGYKKK
tara:strand:- start:291 stop:473 length:183 start_codon:yes stop_codon:yes gene_type:complete